VKRLGACLVALAVGLASLAARADPTKDECINANESAQALRTARRLRDAAIKLELCVAKSCPGPVRDDCAERLNDVQKALPTVVFAVRSGGGPDLIAVRVKMDGVLLTTKLDGSAITVDPGPHAFVFEARGFAPFDETLLIREGEKERHEEIVLPVDAEIPSPAPPPASAAGAPSAIAPSAAAPSAAALPSATASTAPDTTTPPVAAPGRPGSTERVVSFATLGLGVAGIAVGSIFGGLAMGDKASLNRECNNGYACPRSAQGDINALHSNGLIADVGFGVGIVGLAAGTILFLVSGHGDGAGRGGMGAMTPVIGLGGTGVKGTFR
jgi:hypothetical protein